MSLNGLDAPAVQEAYGVSVNESAGWFLLKYVSRDTVELLNSGKAGVTEARAELAQYEDMSPLYGLIMFRRRKVLLKYVPEGTSRLLQARTTVHFQHVLESYSPHDALLEFSSAEGLNDTSLAGVFPLHTSSPSLMNGPLDEITEDAEEGPSPRRPVISKRASASSMSSRKATLDRISASMRPLSPASPPLLQVSNDMNPDSPRKSSISQFLVREGGGHQSVTPLNNGPASEFASSGRRLSDYGSPLHSSDAPNPFDSYSRSSGDGLGIAVETFDFRPKVKLGPRPVNVSEKRKGPLSAGVRPTSALPAGYQIKSKQADANLQRLSQEPLRPPENPLEHLRKEMTTPPILPSAALPTPPPIPETAEYDFPRPKSRGSSRSLPASKTKSMMTPEKQRLMKAVEMRKKQMRKSQSGEKAAVAGLQQSPTIPEEAPAGAEDAESGLQDKAAPTPDHKTIERTEREDASDSLSKKADSGINVECDSDDVGEQRSTKLNETRHLLEGDISETKLDSHEVPTSTKKPQETEAGSSGPYTESAVAFDPKTKADSVDKEIPSLGVEHDTNKVDSTPILSVATEIQSASEDQSSPEADRHKLLDAGHDDRGRHSNRGSTSAASERLATPEPQSAKSEEQQKRRRGLVLPVNVHLNDDATDFEYSDMSDEEFMEELQGATLHEARPVTVSKSPATPVFRQPSYHSNGSNKSSSSVTPIAPPSPTPVKRTQSHTMDTPVTLEGPSMTDDQANTQQQSLSLSVPPAPPLKDQTDHIPVKRLVSTGISRRIADLAESTKREANSQALPTSPTYSSPPVSPHNTIPMRMSTLSSRVTRQAPVAPSKWSASKAAVPDNGQTVYTVQKDPGSQRDSVSVTARIIRSPSKHEGSSSATSAPSEFLQSPLVVTHQRAAPPQLNMPTRSPSLPSPELGKEELPVSPRIRQGSIAAAFSRTSTESSRLSHKSLSFGRHRNVDAQSQQAPAVATEVAPSMSVAGGDEPKSNRASRFFKRMSTMGGNKKRLSKMPTTVSATTLATPENTTPSISNAPLSPQMTNDETSRKISVVSDSNDVPPAVIIGDVNVQFPDQGLWKRRWVEIDASGNLVFNVTKYRDSRPGGTKHYHLTNFKRIYLPDLDRQELAHSVVLTMNGGAELQCACEDGTAQRQLHHLLKSYHQAWLSAQG